MSNPFEQLADKQMVAATKAKHRRREAKVVQSEKDAPMKLSAMEQNQADKSTQFRAYKRAKKSERLVVFERHPADWTSLSNLLKHLTIDNTDTLLDYVNEAEWLRHLDLGARRVVLDIIATELMRVRLENGYAPFDDSLPGEEPTLFEIIREKLNVLVP